MNTDLNPLACSVVVYRTLTARKQFRDGRPTSMAFLRRRQDVDGISVDYNVSTAEECGRKLSGKKAIISLLTGHVRDIGLDIEADSNTHASITGLPSFEELEDNPLTAERMAAELVGISRNYWEKE